MGDTLDIEETNRLRAALGMTLLPTSNGKSNLAFKTPAAANEDDDSDSDPGSTLDSRQAAAGDNWRKLQDDAIEKKRREQKRTQLKKERDAAQRFAKLEGKGLGDAGNEDVDTRSWLLASRKRQKKIEKERARLLQQELEERENQAQYTEKDLMGRKVAHEIDDFDEGGEHVLTLKDTAIGEESEDDELENAELREKEKLNDRLKLKKQKAAYDPNVEDEDGKQGVLGKYDEEIEGKKQKHFTLDGLGRTQEEANGTFAGRLGPQGMKISLDLQMDDKPTGDYVDISEIKIKKPKKKKEKSKRRRSEDELDPFTIEGTVPASVEVKATDVEISTPNVGSNGNKRKHEDASFADDDDLQSTLASQRRAALKKRKRSRPEDLARQLREEASATPGGDEMDTNDEEGGLVIDETSEFVANLQRPPAPEARRTSSAKVIKREGATPGLDGDVAMNGASDSDDDNLDETPHIKREPSPSAPDPHTATGLADEENFNNAGIGATLGMLTQRGLVKAQGGSDLNTSQSRQAHFLAHKDRLEKDWERRAQEKRKRDRDAGLFERHSKRQQEEYAQQENKNRDQFVSRQLDELFNREYKPNVELKYVDEFGRHMDSREAFKQMSHQFHGKGSGKLKTEKRLKKIKEEQEREAKSSLDSSQMSGMTGVAGSQARKQRAAGVRLQ